MSHTALLRVIKSCKQILASIPNLWWKRGWILNSLKYQIEKQLRESIYENETYKGVKWNHLERRFLYHSKHPYVSAINNFSMLLIFLLVLFFGIPYLSNLFPSYKIDNVYPKGWLSILLQCQVTILGLIFPLVVALIGISLQSQSANRALWEIYKRYSSLYYNGMSGLLLIFAIVSTQFIRPFLSQESGTVLTIGLIVWFLYNIELLCWFLFATIEFVSIAKRSHLLLRYSINEIFLDDIKLRLSQQLPQHAVRFKLIQGLDEVDAFTDGITTNEPQIKTFGFNNKKGTYPFQISFKKIKYLDNIYFRLLNFGVSLWRKSLVEIDSSQSHKLSLPINGWSQGAKKWDLAISSNEELNFFSKALFWLSYTFRRSPSIDTSSFNQILNALVGNIEDALKENNVRLFDIALEEMMTWHNQIAESLAFVNDEKQWDNWMLLTDGSFFGRSYLEELQREYWTLIKSSLSKLFVSREYFEKFCYFFLGVHGFQNKKLAIKIRTELISSHASIWSILMDWYADREAEDQIGLIDKPYKGVIRKFVGSWESWSYRLCPHEDDELFTPEMVKSLVHHLQQTSQIVFKSIITGENYSVKVSVDLLLIWYEKAFWKNRSGYFSGYQEILTHTILDQKERHPFWDVIDKQQQLKHNESICIAMKNAWIDIRIVTACYIIKETLSEQESSLNPYAEAIITGKSFDDIGALRAIPNCIMKGGDVLFAYLKHLWFCGDEKNTYSGWIDSVVTSFYHSKPTPPRITGRVYSGDVGDRTVRGLSDVYILLTIFYSNNEWSLEERFINDILPDKVTYEAKKRLLWELEGWTSPDIKIIKKSLSLLGEDKLDKYLRNYLLSIDKIKDVIDGLVTKKVVEAEIDIDKILDISQQASKTGFDLNNDYIPTSLFKTIKYIEDLDIADEYSVTIGGYRKETIAKGVLESSSSHLDSAFSKYIAENVRTNLYRLFFNDLKFIVRENANIKETISDIIRDSRELIAKGLTPICFVGADEIDELLNHNRWKYSENNDLLPHNIFKKEDVKLVDYICHIEDVEVFHLPFRNANFCMLAAKECFLELGVRENINDKYVSASFIPSKDDRTRGLLKLSYWMSATFRQLPSYKYILGEK